MLNKIEFLIAEAFVAFRRNGLMSVAAVSTMTVALFLLGGLGYLYIRINAAAQDVPTQLEIRVFLKDGTKTATISEVAKTIRGFKGVAEARYIPRDKAWEKTKQEMPEVTEGLENPLPDSFKVKLNDLNMASQIRDEIRKIPEVDPNGIVYFADAFNYIANILKFIKWFGSIVGGALFITAGVLIHNAIRLTIIARRREIRIMQLVGATQTTVGMPFLIEGMFHGIVGGVLALLLLWPTQIALEYNALKFMFSSGVGHQVDSFPVGMMLFLLCTVGAIYGFGCSALAIREPLKLK